MIGIFYYILFEPIKSRCPFEEIADDIQEMIRTVYFGLVAAFLPKRRGLASFKLGVRLSEKPYAF